MNDYYSQWWYHAAALNEISLIRDAIRAVSLLDRGNGVVIEIANFFLSLVIVIDKIRQTGLG